MIFKGYIYNLVGVRDVISKIVPVESVPIVNEFLDVFLEEFSVFLLKEK